MDIILLIKKFFYKIVHYVHCLYFLFSYNRTNDLEIKKYRKKQCVYDDLGSYCHLIGSKNRENN